jgi:electron transfer flavoprotein alpha subunit
MSILVLAEHDNNTLSSSTLKTINAASQINTSVDLLIAGLKCETVAEQASKITGVSQVLLADNDAYQHQLAENIAPLIISLADKYQYFIATASTTGKNIMPRVSAMLDVTQISEITGIESEDTFYRPIYAGNAIAKVKSLDAKKVLTVRATVFDAATLTGNANIVPITTIFNSNKVKQVNEQLTVSERPELSSAAVVISGGRGMQNADNFKLLENIADKVGGAIGASRAAVDAGFVANDLQVGQTGKIVAPDLYIAVGISGAIQHLAGMKESKVIVAINKDPDAPIFQVADYGLVADLFDVLPELAAKL